MKIAIVGDVHITDKVPRCRVDDYFSECIKKLDYIASHNDKVIILGDLFHTCSNSDIVIHKMQMFLSNHPGKFISILGNHDLYYGNVNSLHRTTIGCLHEGRFLEVKTNSFNLGGVEFCVSHVIKDLKKISVDKTNEKILLGHNYFDMELQPDESFTRKDIEDLNYKLVFLGHDHKPYEDEFIGNSILVRMGSLTRMDAQAYNEGRQVYYYQYDTEAELYERKAVPCRPTENVYKEGVYSNKKVNKKKVYSFSDLGSLLESLDGFSGGSESLDKTLIEINATKEERSNIRSVHIMCDEVYS